jgi:hypothetical protein
MTYMTPEITVIGRIASAILGSGQGIPDNPCNNTKVGVFNDCHSELEAEW